MWANTIVSRNMRFYEILKLDPTLTPVTKNESIHLTPFCMNVYHYGVQERNQPVFGHEIVPKSPLRWSENKGYGHFLLLSVEILRLL